MRKIFLNKAALGNSKWKSDVNMVCFSLMVAFEPVDFAFALALKKKVNHSASRNLYLAVRISNHNPLIFLSVVGW